MVANYHHARQLIYYLGCPNISNMLQMRDSKIIDQLGGTTVVARLCDIKPPSVSEWRRKGIPKARIQYLSLIRPDIFTPAGER